MVTVNNFDPLLILKVEREVASIVNVKKAYFRESARHHPSVGGDKIHVSFIE